MNRDKARTQQEIFNDMHRELRAWNPKVAESPDRLDPILRIVLQLYSNQLSKIDQRIDDLWGVAKDSLIRSLYPECKRWPVPAYTVMCCQPADPVVEVDPHTRFYYREKREGGQTFFFSTQRTEKLINAEVKHIFLTVGSRLVDLSPTGDGQPLRHDKQHLPFSASQPGRLYMAVEYADRPENFAGTNLFVKGNPDVLKQMRWGHWYPSSAAGTYYEDSGYCPGLTCSIDSLIADTPDEQVDWGGLRSSKDLLGSVENNFVTIKPEFAQTWEAGPADPGLAELLNTAGIQLASEGGRFYWIRVDLPARGDKQRLIEPIQAHFSCFIATNKNELTLFKHTGGNRLVEVEIPEAIENILEITSVVDSGNRDYTPHHQVHADAEVGSYSLEERKNRLVLWFDFSSHLHLPPDSITVTYTVTGGAAANGIEVGRINELYENHPGIISGENVLPVAGAVPAKTEQQVSNEVSARLRSRDRALSFAEIANWATGFDPRIRKVECRNGIERTSGGVRRCIVVGVTAATREFYSDDEIELLTTRLKAFLKSRAPVNTQFQVEIIAA